MKDLKNSKLILNMSNLFPSSSKDQFGTIQNLQRALIPQTTLIIPFLKKLEVKFVDFRIMVDLNSKIRKASHKNGTALRVNIGFH